MRERATKVTGVLMAVMCALMVVVPLLSGEGLILPLSVYFLLFILFESIVILVYYLMFGIFKQQIHSAMKEHYTDVIEEFKKNKENAKWKHGKS